MTKFKDIRQELTLESSKNYLFDLSYLGIIDVIGEKAIDFLQGQLTCNLHLLSDIQIIQGAQCNLKGRILALMDILFWQGIKLVLPKDLLELTLNSLSKTAMLSRVLIKETTKLRVLGFYLQNTSDLMPEMSFFPNTLYAQAFNDQLCYYHLGQGFYIFLVPVDKANNLVQCFQEQEQFLGSVSWHTLRLMHNQIDIYPESRGLFLPHRLDLHKTQYISFNKGCYKGQEIIARMHYKGTLKHQMKRYFLKTDQKLYSGQKLLNILDGTELGELIDFSPLSGDHYIVALSILKNAESLVLFEGHLNPIELIEYSVESP